MDSRQAWEYVLPKLSVVIPCYNEQGAIDDGVRTILNVLTPENDWELIIVDDGSKDGTHDELERLNAEIEEMRVVKHELNRGYGAALKTGIRAAKGERILITDADGTYPACHIPDLLAAADDIDADMVVGARIGENVQYSSIRRFAKIWMIWYSSWITRYPIPDINSGLRVFRKSTLEKYISLLPDSFSFTTTITIAMLSNNEIVKYIPIDYNKRIGKSKIRPVRDTLNFLQLIFRMGALFAPMRAFMPFVLIFGIGFVGSAFYDIVFRANLADKTILLFMMFQSTFLFSVLADLIHRHKKW